MQDLKEMFLIDGTALIYRSYFAFINNPLKDSYGNNTSAIFGVANSFLKLLIGKKPHKIIISFDLKAPTFRNQLSDDYKANRPPAPDDLIKQIEPIKEFFKMAGIPEISYEGYEADDVIATLTHLFRHKYKIIIVTSDKDFNQLVDENTNLYDPFSEKTINKDEVVNKYGVTPEQFIDYLTIVGDSSDNIAGIKGIGAKGAKTLLQEYGTIENIYANIDNIKSKSIKEKLIDGKESAELSKKLITLTDNISIKQILDINTLEEKSTFSQKELINLIPILKKYDLSSIIRKVNELYNNSVIDTRDDIQTHPEKEAEQLSFYNENNEASVKRPNTEPKNTAQQSFEFYTDPFYYEIVYVNTEKELDSIFEKLLSASYYSFDLCFIESNNEKTILGISICFGNEKVYFLNIEPTDSSEDIIKVANEEGSLKNKWLQKVAALNENNSTSQTVISHNIKPIYLLLKTSGLLPLTDGITKHISPNNYNDRINNETTLFDTMIASYLIEANHSRYNIEACVSRELHYQIDSDEKLDNKRNNDVILHKSAQNAFFSYRLFEKQKDSLAEKSLEKLFYQIETPLLAVLAIMERNGVYVDQSILNDINVVISKEIERLTNKVFSLTGTEFNINSPKQLSKILFEDMGITPLKKTKTGFSTDNIVLEQLADNYEIAQYLIDYRQLTKLRSTYVESLPDLINIKTGKIHSSFNQTVTTTGRLSSSNPNLQNIPIRTEVGRQIRKAFRSKENNLILSADYSQIELRLLGIMSKDRNLITAFNNHQDIHSQTAGLILGKPITMIDSDERRMAKTINFGILYGMGYAKLSRETGISQKEAKDFIEQYFKKFPRIKDFIQSQIKEAKTKGYAQTLMGRRLYLPNIHGSNKKYLSEAERVAVNMPIQGTAADIIKIAMVKVYSEIEKLRQKMFAESSENLSEKDFIANMLIQVHDELVFEVQEEHLKLAKDIISQEMKNALPEKYRIIIPLEVDIGFGNNWYEAHS